MWYHSGVRTTVVCLVAALSVAGCGAAGNTTAPPSPATSTAASGSVDPAAIGRARGAVPAGYEVSDIAETAAPVTFWGFAPGWTATPEQCGALADPGAGTRVRGWSASGSGGIIYAVVAGPGAHTGIPEGCAAWSVTGGHTAAAVTLAPAPAVAATSTVAMSAVVTTTVEGGTQTRLHGDTVTAYLPGGYIASVTAVTDPGSALQPLPSDIAPRLLAQVVSVVTR